MALSEIPVNVEAKFRGVVASLIYDPKRREILLSKRAKDPYKDKLGVVSGKGWPDFVDTPREGAIDEVKVELGTDSFQPLSDDPTFIWNEGTQDEIYVYVGTVNREEIDPLKKTKFSQGSFWLSIDQLRVMDDGYLAFEHVKLIKKFIELLDRGKLATGWR